mmetsp:Transcript_16311/g.54625  ORF Transcript_16311/g.54625 Transcript_16311/m.54625 type:complete len:605 (+) Transcript_16311:181-1995(+)
MTDRSDGREGREHYDDETADPPRRRYGPLRRVMGAGFNREGDNRRVTRVTSFVSLNSASLWNLLLADLATQLLPWHRYVVALHLIAVLFLPTQSVFALCICDFFLLPAKAFLTCLLVLSIVELWEDLQVALMLVALILGLWSLQRLWRMFIRQWAKTLLLLCAKSAYGNCEDYSHVSPRIRRFVLFTLSSSQQLSIARSPSFVQAELAILFKLASASLKERELLRHALQSCLRLLITLEDSMLLLDVCDKLVQSGVVSSLSKMLLVEDMEVKKIAIEILGMMSRTEDTSSILIGQDREILTSIVDTLHRYKLTSPHLASSACAAIADVCSHDVVHEFILATNACSVLLEAARLPGISNLQVYAARSLLSLSCGVAMQPSSSLEDGGGLKEEHARSQEVEERARDIYDLFFEFLTSKPPPPPSLCHLACQYFRKLLSRGHHDPLARLAISQGIIRILFLTLRDAGETAIVMEALPALACMTMTGEDPLLDSMKKLHGFLPAIHRLLTHQDGAIRRHAWIALLYLHGRLLCRSYGMISRRHCDEERCPICWNDYTLDDTVVVLPDCHHVFHHACINSWLVGKQGTSSSAINHDCPLCKRIISVVPL